MKTKYERFRGWQDTDKVKEGVNIYVSNLVTVLGKDKAMKAIKAELEFWN